MTKLSLVRRDTLAKVFWEPYIYTGYRLTDISVWDCLRYTLVLHNDVGNFWTHFVPLPIWIAWLAGLAAKLDFSDPFWYPLLVLWFGGCCYAFCSSMAHCMAAKSANIRQICFMIDYLGIALYGFGGDVAYLFYERAIGSVLYEYKWTLIAVYAVSALNSTVVCSLSRFYCQKWRFLIRPFSYVVGYLGGLFPFCHRLFLCYFYGEDCITDTLYLHFMTVLVTYIMVFFFVSKFPERIFPGKFDYIFHSHQLFHIAAAIITCLQFYYVPLDAQNRREQLLQNPYMVPDVYTTFIAMAFVTLGGFSIVAVFGLLVVSNLLPCNKRQGKKD